MSYVSEIEKQVNFNEKLIEDLNDKLQKKASKFSEFDLKAKFYKRIKQLDEGKNYAKKVKNRSNKMVKKILEMGDMNFNEENRVHLERLGEEAKQYRQDYDEAAATQVQIQK